MIRLAMTALAAVLVSILFTASAAAEICMYRDEQGHITYSNVTDAPPRNATKIRCFREKQPAATPNTTAAPPAPAETGESFPSVDRDTQRQRDAGRRSILEDELAAEEQSLQEARRQLQAQESIRRGSDGNSQSYRERIRPYQEAVQTHERNVQALQRELETLR